MVDNIAAKITVDVVDVQAKLALAKTEMQAATKAMQDMARSGAAVNLSGTLTPEMLKSAEAAATTTARYNSLRTEMKNLTTSSGIGQQALQTLGSVMQGGLGALGLATAVAAVTAKIVEMGIAAFESAAHVAHEAEVLQLSISSYQDFAESAVLSGVAVDQVDTALRRFMSNLGAAQEGSAAQAKALRDLGVDAYQTGEVALPQVAKALLAMADDGRRARIETTLFGRSGEELNPVLEKWAQGTDALNAQLTLLGVKLSDDDAKGALAAKLQFTQFEEEMRTKWTPAVIGASQAAIKLGEAATFLLQQWEPALFLHMPDKFVGQLETAADAAKAVADAHKKMIDRAKEAADDEDRFGGRIEKVTHDIDTMKAALLAVKGDPDTPEKIANMKRWSTEIAEATRELDKLKKEQSGEKGIGGGFSSFGEKAIAEARNAISTIDAVEDQSNVERLTKDAAVWQQLLQNHKLNAAQRLQVEDNYNRTLRELNQARAREEETIAKGEVETAVRINALKLQAARDEAQAEFAAHQINADEFARIEQNLLDEEFLNNRRVIEDNMKKFGVLTAEYRKYLNDLLVLDAEYDAKKAANDRQAEQNHLKELREEIQATRDAYNQMTSAADSFVSNVLSGQMTIQQALLRSLGDILKKEIETDAKAALAHIFYSKEELAADQALGQTGLIWHLLFETKKTAATAAGEASRLATKEAAHAAGAAEDVASGSAQILNDAYKAAAGAYQAVVGIPIVGPFLAPIAAGVAFAAVSAFDVMTSAEGGDYKVRGGFYELHKNEAVMPAHIANPMRDFFSGDMMQRTENANREVHFHFAPTVTYHHPTTMDDLLATQGNVLKTWINARVRDGSMQRAMMANR